MNLLLYAFAGGVEWWLALRRQSAHSAGRRLQVALIVFAEVMLSLYVLGGFLSEFGGWSVGVSYALGCAAGALLAR